MDDPIELLREGMNRLRGRLFEQVESFGVPERQERAVKSVVRRTTYDLQAELEATIRNARRASD